MNDVFVKRVRAAAIAGWWTVLDRRPVHHAAMDHLPHRHVGSTRVAFVDVGTRNRLALRPAGLVLGHRVPQVRLVADGLDRNLAYAMGEAVAEAGGKPVSEAAR